MPATDREIEFAESLEIWHAKLAADIKPIVEALEKSRNNDNRKWVNESIKYWNHVLAALEWSVRLAQQKAAKK